MVKRLLRAEAQEKTREALVSKAKTLFLRDGYHLTSLEKVARAAGLSKGAVYSNFRNKDELCLAVIDQIHQSEVSQIASAFTLRGSLEVRVSAFEAWAERMIGDAGWTQLEIELAIHARRDPALRAEIAKREQLVRSAFATLVAAQGDEFGTKPLLPPELLATALLSLGIGIGIRRIIEPGLSIEALTESFRVLSGMASEEKRAKKRRKRKG